VFRCKLIPLCGSLRGSNALAPAQGRGAPLGQAVADAYIEDRWHSEGTSIALCARGVSEKLSSAEKAIDGHETVGSKRGSSAGCAISEAQVTTNAERTTSYLQYRTIILLHGSATADSTSDFKVEKRANQHTALTDG